MAYFGDSVTDPRNSGSKLKYWHLLEQWLDIKPYVYAVSGREWNDIPNQTNQLQSEHGDDVDAILIFIGTNDYNHAVPIGRWYEEVDTLVDVAVGKPRATVQRKMRKPVMDNMMTPTFLCNEPCDRTYIVIAKELSEWYRRIRFP